MLWNRFWSAVVVAPFMPRDLISLGLAGFQALLAIGFVVALNVLFQALMTMPPETQETRHALGSQTAQPRHMRSAACGS